MVVGIELVLCSIRGIALYPSSACLKVDDAVFLCAAQDVRDKYVFKKASDDEYKPNLDELAEFAQLDIFKKSSRSGGEANTNGDTTSKVADLDVEVVGDDEGPKTAEQRQLEEELGSLNMDDMMAEMVKGKSGGIPDMDPDMMAAALPQLQEQLQELMKGGISKDEVKEVKQSFKDMGIDLEDMFTKVRRNTFLGHVVTHTTLGPIPLPLARHRKLRPLPAEDGLCRRRRRSLPSPLMCLTARPALPCIIAAHDRARCLQARLGGNLTFNASLADRRDGEGWALRCRRPRGNPVLQDAPQHPRQRLNGRSQLGQHFCLMAS